MNWLKGLAAVALMLAAGAAGLLWYLDNREAFEPSRVAYGEHCAECHGANLEGGDLGPALLDAPLRYGDSTPELIASIAIGYPERGMPGFSGAIEADLVKGLALFVSERRQNFPIAGEVRGLAIPEAAVESIHHRFRVEPFAALAGRAYGMAPLPDGRILVTEKSRGLSIVTRDGTQRAPVTGTPEIHPPLLDTPMGPLVLGIMLDVALDPDYADNGWIYLSYTERCHLDCGSLVPASMVRVVRGRLDGDHWIDEELLWSAHHDHYTPVPDQVAAGRLTLDHDGHVYVTIGGKAVYSWVQQLHRPTGKIHRVRADGSVPEDNPFWVPDHARNAASTEHTVFSYGHRTTQGLDTHPGTGEVWSTEMGPRGGDEVNLIVAGGNYGWPMFTNGLDYDGDQITIGADLGLDLAIEDTISPVVDFTPAPAISNFTFYAGEAFPRWSHDLLVGTLKARTLYRLRIEDGVLLEQEKLVTDLGRMRDVGIGADGFVYLLLEHGDDASIVRLVPAAR